MKILIISACACVISQLVKVAISLIHKKRVHFYDFFTTGGMPSAHSATVSAMMIAVAVTEGVSSVAFGISVVLAFIVICDAAGLRRSVGKQAESINNVIRELKTRYALTDINNDSSELVGHTILQVIAGTLLGAAVACLWFWLLE